MILVLAFYICGPHQDQVFCQFRCRRSTKSTGGMGSLLLSSTSFWVGLTVMLDHVMRELFVKVPTSMLGRHLLNRTVHYVSMIW